VAIYLGVTLALSFSFEAWMILSAGGLAALGGLSPMVLMWIPGLCSLGVRLAGGEGFQDVGWRAGPWRYWALAFSVPAVCAGFTYLASWLGGFVVFGPKSSLAIASPHLRWLVAAAINAVLGTLIGGVAALGEELGWRSYLLPRWVQAELPAPVIATGAIWGLWHLPIILWGDYATSSRPIVSALLFLVVITLSTAFFSWVRLAGGSVWTATLAHASHNAFYQGVFDRHFHGPLEPYVAGEQGLFSIVAYAAVALWLWRTGRLRRALDEPVFFAQKKTG
jgi:membrane protease YdiL (CAAX protease family)